MITDEELEAIERRFDRVLARKEGRQEGTVGVVAMISAMDIPDLVAAVQQLRYERRLLGACRRHLDEIADPEGRYTEAAIKTAGDLAQRIVDEIGHSVTDEPPLGPDFREQIKDLERQRDEALAEAERLRGGAAEEERALMQVIAERDDREQVADALAEAIARLVGVEIGEHSSANDPWRNALDAAGPMLGLPDMAVEVERLKVQASNYAYQRDTARQERDKAVRKAMQMRPVVDAAQTWAGLFRPMRRDTSGEVRALIDAVDALDVTTPSQDREPEHAFDEGSVLNPVTGKPYGPGPLCAGTEPMDYPDPMCVCGALWGEDDRCSDDPAARPELPWALRTPEGHTRLRVHVWPSLEAPRTGALTVADGWAEFTVDELEQGIAAMTEAVRQIRAHVEPSALPDTRED